MEGLDPLSRWRYTFGEPLYLMREVAESLGVSPASIRARCASNPGLAPRIERYGGQGIWLFTPEITEAIRIDFERRPARPGRPRLWSTEEQTQRRRQRVAKHYWKRMAELNAHQDRPERADRAQRRAEEIEHALRIQRPGAS